MLQTIKVDRVKFKGTITKWPVHKKHTWIWYKTTCNDNKFSYLSHAVIVLVLYAVLLFLKSTNLFVNDIVGDYNVVLEINGHINASI